METSREPGESTAAGWAEEIRRRVISPSPPNVPPPGSPLLYRHGPRDMHFVAARSARLLVNATEAFPEMLAAIDVATEHVELETYILRDDTAGRNFQQALMRAASRGVQVRLLYDWVGSFALPARFVRELVDAGVAASAYHPLVVRRPVWAVNQRDHRKLLIVDDAVSFTGGLNIGDEYQGVQNGGQGWRDTHVRLEGPDVAREMLALFEYAWRRATPFRQTLTRRNRIISTMRRRMAALSRPKDRLGNLDKDGTIAVSVVGNEQLRHRHRIHRAYLRVIRAAQRYVLIENAYFIPSRPVRRALIGAARRGVFVAVVVGAQSDVPVTAYATRWLYDQLLSGGVRLFEWPISVMHAKTAVVDDGWSIIGSFNFDHRSLLHQLESVAVVADLTVAVDLRNQTLADIAQCREIVLEKYRRRSRWKKVVEYAAYLLRHWL